MSQKVKGQLTPFRFKEGDIVTTKPTGIHSFSETKEASEIFHRIRNNPRKGVVVETYRKPDKRGHALKMCLIKWDHSERPSEHFEPRLCFWEDLAKVQKNAIDSIAP